MWMGGTIGDIESLPFIEAIRQFHNDNGAANSLFIHVTLVPCAVQVNKNKTCSTFSKRIEEFGYTTKYFIVQI